jgi:hypothetical protein
VLEIGGPAEIANLHDAMAVQEVLGFNVTVDYEVRVHILDCFKNLENDFADKCRLGAEHMIQGFPMDVLHDQEDVVGIREPTIQLHDIRMRQLFQAVDLVHDLVVHFVVIHHRLEHLLQGEDHACLFMAKLGSSLYNNCTTSPYFPSPRGLPSWKCCMDRCLGTVTVGSSNNWNDLLGFFFGEDCGDLDLLIFALDIIAVLDV